MSARPTIADLARTAGVSIATVDRVLNGRHKVREETARRVYDAANAIGYHAAGLLRRRIFEDLRQYRLGFILQKPGQFFYQSMAKEIGNAALTAPGVRIIPHIDFNMSVTPAALTEKLRSVASRNHAVALVCPDHPAVTATVGELKEAGIPVFSLLSDFAAGVREGYVGLNNHMVGRTAAWMIARAAKRPGKVATFIGSHRFHGHELREIGFRAYFRENAPEFKVLDTLVNLDTAEITHEATINLLHRHPDLIGFYVCGGGMEGAISALAEEQPAGKRLVVVNELTPESRAALTRDLVTMVISTPVVQVTRALIGQMVSAIDRGVAGVPGQTLLPFDIFTPENI